MPPRCVLGGIKGGLRRGVAPSPRRIRAPSLIGGCGEHNVEDCPGRSNRADDVLRNRTDRAVDPGRHHRPAAAAAAQAETDDCAIPARTWHGGHQRDSGSTEQHQLPAATTTRSRSGSNPEGKRGQGSGIGAKRAMPERCAAGQCRWPVDTDREMPLGRVTARQLGYQGSDAFAGRRGATLALPSGADRVDQGNVLANRIQ